MNKSRLLSVVCALLATVISPSANSALFSALMGQGVFDSDLDITYLADPLSAATSGVDDGFMTLGAAQSYVGQLNNTFFLGFDNWTLPFAKVPDFDCTDDAAGVTASLDEIGFNCLGGHLGHLFYTELGGAAGNSFGTITDVDIQLFDPVPDRVFWTGREDPDDPNKQLTFLSINGFQTSHDKSFGLGAAWVVRSGGASTVDVIPLPGAVWLFGSALGLLGWMRRRKTAKSLTGGLNRVVRRT